MALFEAEGFAATAFAAATLAFTGMYPTPHRRRRRRGSAASLHIQIDEVDQENIIGRRRRTGSFSI
jgi:hypothetical protein